MKKSFITLALFLLFSCGLKAQNFVEEIEESKAKISAKFKSKLDKLKRDDTFESIHFVNFNELKRIQKDGRITLTLPKLKEPVELITFRMEYKTDTDYNWYATTKDGFGSVIIMRKGDEYTGHFSFRGNNEYQIYNENGQHILVKMKPVKADYSKCSTKSDRKSNNIEPQKSSSERTSECFNPIRVLVLWTANAANADVNINNTINTAIGQFNNSIYRSNIGNTSIVLAWSQQIDFAETNNIDTDILRLATSIGVESLRDNTDADLVVLLTNSDYGYRGTIRDFVLDRAFGHAIVQVEAAASNAKTFSHELGHLFDARHNYDNDNSGLPYAHGYRFSTGWFSNMCTLMYAGADDRIENFSNPDVSISGNPTGTASTENNARRISETASTVRNYEPNPNLNNLASSIYGPSHGYVNQSYTWEADTRCVEPPFNYEWLTSTDGFNWYYKGTGEFFTDALPWSGNSYYYIWLRVSAPNGQVSNSYLTVYTNYNGGARMAASDDKSPLSAAPIAWKDKSRESPLEEGDKLTIENVFPNPSLSNFTLNFFNPTTQNISLDIVDVSGKKSSIFADEKMGIGKHSKPINLNKYPIGTYILKLSSEKESVSSKIIVTQ